MHSSGERPEKEKKNADLDLSVGYFQTTTESSDGLIRQDPRLTGGVVKGTTLHL